MIWWLVTSISKKSGQTTVVIQYILQFVQVFLKQTLFEKKPFQFWREIWIWVVVWMSKLKFKSWTDTLTLPFLLYFRCANIWATKVGNLWSSYETWSWKLVSRRKAHIVCQGKFFNERHNLYILEQLALIFSCLVFWVLQLIPDWLDGTKGEFAEPQWRTGHFY